MDDAASNSNKRMRNNKRIVNKQWERRRTNKHIGFPKRRNGIAKKKKTNSFHGRLSMTVPSDEKVSIKSSGLRNHAGSRYWIFMQGGIARSASQSTVSFIRSPSASLTLEIVGLLREILRSLRYSIPPIRAHGERVYRGFLTKWDTSPTFARDYRTRQCEYFYKISIAHLFRYN